GDRSLDAAGVASARRIARRVEVLAGPPAQVSLQLPGSPVRAGGELAVRAAVSDAMGNGLSRVALDASLGGAPARISWEGTTASITCAVPGRLPPDATIELVVRSSDAARAVARIDLRPGEAASAEL